MKHVRFLAPAALLFVAAAGTAEAAAVRSGVTSVAIAALTRGNAVAYDSVNHVYLVVGSNGTLRGRFVDAAGSALGQPFTIQANPANFAHFPRVAFSPQADSGAGAFLVTWHEGAPSPHARLVSFTKNGPIGPDTQLSGDVSWWEAGAAVSYSATSQEFLVAWRRLGGKGINNDIHAARVDLAGAVKALVEINNDADYQDNPSIAWNSAADEFMVVYSGFNDPGNFAYVEGRRVKAGTGALLGNATRLTQTSGTYITDVVYNAATGKYLASWYALPAAAALARVIEADGTLTGNIITLSTRWKAYDALSVGYNRRSNTSFMVSHGTTCDDGGVEIDTNGTPVDNGFVATATGCLSTGGNFYPRIAASADDPNWLISTANNFTSTMVQLIAGTAAAGAPAPTPAPPTPAPTPTPTAPQPNPKMNVDSPSANGGVAASGFLVSGWAIDQGAPAGASTGVDVVQVWAYPTGTTNAMFIGTATYGIARPDVAAFAGAQFANSGFTLMGSLPAAGSYDIYVFAHSTLTDTFSNVRAVRVTATDGNSNPRMFIDLPGTNQTVGQSFQVGGWAIDLGAASGSGVDAIHVWAYPTAGAPIALGIAEYGRSRPDIANYGGDPRFGASGYLMTATLPAGDYSIVVFAHSTVTNTFNNVMQVPVKVR